MAVQLTDEQLTILITRLVGEAGKRSAGAMGENSLASSEIDKVTTYQSGKKDSMLERSRPKCTKEMQILQIKGSWYESRATWGQKCRQCDESLLFCL
jgi:hypothetical protein